MFFREVGLDGESVNGSSPKSNSIDLSKEVKKSSSTTMQAMGLSGCNYSICDDVLNQLSMTWNLQSSTIHGWFGIRFCRVLVVVFFFFKVQRAFLDWGGRRARII